MIYLPGEIERLVLKKLPFRERPRYCDEIRRWKAVVHRFDRARDTTWGENDNLLFSIRVGKYNRIRLTESYNGNEIYYKVIDRVFGHEIVLRHPTLEPVYPSTISWVSVNGDVKFVIHDICDIYKKRC
jgi:hypothetical protein